MKDTEEFKKIDRELAQLRREAKGKRQSAAKIFINKMNQKPYESITDDEGLLMSYINAERHGDSSDINDIHIILFAIAIIVFNIIIISIAL